MDKPGTWFIIDDADLSASYMYLEGSIEVVSLAYYEALKADRDRLRSFLEAIIDAPERAFDAHGAFKLAIRYAREALAPASPKGDSEKEPS